MQPVPRLVPVPRSAFSLAELMIALAVLGIGLLFIAAALPVGIAYTRDSVDLESAQACGDAAAQILKRDMHLSRQLVPIGPMVNRPGRSPAEQLPATSTGLAALPTNMPVRNEPIFRPRQIPPPSNLAANYWRYPSNLEPREGSNDHPYNDTDPSPVVTGPNWKPDSRAWGYEPFIKVRPLTMANLSLDRQAGWLKRVVDDGEFVIERYLSAVGLIDRQNMLLEADDELFLRSATLYPNAHVSLLRNPPFSALDRFFPAIGPALPFRAEQYINTANPVSNVYRRDFARNVGTNPPQQVYSQGYLSGELNKALDRRIAWTAFYRRLAYDTVSPGPVGGFDGPRRPNPLPPNYIGDDVYNPSDPQLYELIVVVTRRPSERHRFPMQEIPQNQQNPGIQWFEQPQAVVNAATAEPASLRGADRLAPMPWLVLFDTSVGPNSADYFMQGLQRYTGLGWPLPSAEHFVDNLQFPNGLGLRRALSPSFPQRSTLRFRVKPEVGRLLAAGSVLIPAANDNFPHNRRAPQGPGNFARPDNRVAGFVPHTPDSFPLYEVLEVIPDSPGSGTGTTVVVKSNGVYPWISAGAEGQSGPAKFWPFWVIPPSFAERLPGGQPIYDRRSPVLGIYREVVRLPEVK